MSAMRQLALPFVHTPRLTWEEFLPHAGTGPALAWLDRIPDWPARRLALWGGPGTGKTHLLEVWAVRAGASLIAGPALRGEWPDGPLAIDDADVAIETSLLHALNAAHEAGHPVLLAARLPPARWPSALPDLASRLRATTAVALGAADDAFLRTLLGRLLSDRQLRVPDAVQDWLLAVLPRDPAALREAASRLDRAALAAGRPIDRALATHALQSLLHDTSDTDAGEISPHHPVLF